MNGVDRANWTIEQLCKAALRDTGKVLVDRIKRATPVKTRLLQKSWQKWVRKNEKGAYYLQIGIYTAAQARKKNQSFAYHAHLVLFGHTTVNGGYVSGNNFFFRTVQDNIDLVRQVQAQYLSAIEDEQRAISIAEAESEKGEEDE